MNKSNKNVQEQDFLAGGGELGELIRAKDWSETSLGSLENWPISLKAIVRVMLTSPQPTWIGWGPELIKLYNDPFKSIVGSKHPAALGQPAAVVWNDNWNEIAPLLKEGLEKNQGVCAEPQLLIIERNGTPEEIYFTFSYSPVPGDGGGIEGIFVQGVDVTDQVRARKEVEEAQGKIEKGAKENNIRFSGASADSTQLRQIEKELKKNEQTIGTVLNNIPGVAFRCLNDKHWTMELISEGALELTGYAPADFLLQKITWSRLIHPDDLERVQKHAKDHIQKKESIKINYRIITAEGEIKWVWDRATPIFSKTGEITNWVGFVTDITERIQAEEALRKNEIRFKTFAEAMPQMAFIADAEGNIIYYNHRWYDYVGIMDGTEGWGWKDRLIHHPDDLERTLEKWNHSLKTGEAYEIEYRLLRHNGEYRWHLGRAVAVRDSKGKIEMWLGTNTDIHGQKQAEVALRKSEEKFRTLADNISNLCWMADSSGWIYWYNSRWYEYTGTTPEEMEGWGWQSVHDPDVLPRVLEKWKASIATGKPFDMVFTLKGADSVFRPFLTRIMPVKDEQGKVRQWFGTNTDITEMLEAEEALRKSEEFNRTLLESSPDCIKALDLDGRLLSMNHQGQMMMEIEDFNSMIGLDWTSLWQAEYNKLAKAALEKAQKGGLGHFQGFRPTIKGTPKWWDVLVAPVYGSDSKVERLISVSRDVTQLKELEKQKDDFIGIASHELKTPVTSIKGFIQIIDRIYKDKSYEMIGKFLPKVELHVDKLTGLINDLLDVSKIQAGKLPYNFSVFTVEEIIADCIEQVSHQSKKHSIIGRGDMSVLVYGDKERLEQVVSNLLTNAIKYSPDAEEVILEVSEENRSLKISVTDFGIGIPEDIQPYVFDRFFRVEQNSHQFQGLGIGLYICAEVVKRHEGTINVKSTKGKGSTFFFTIPLPEK